MLPLRTTNAQNIGARPYQEDCFAIIEADSLAPEQQRCLMAVIADGMGGLAHGDAAARRAVQVFVETFGARKPNMRMEQVLRGSLLAANTAVAREAESRKVPGQMGTTLIAVAIRDDKLYWVSTGDSGLYRVHAGHFERLNQAHVFGAFLDEQARQGEISEELARGNPHREALTSYVGMSRDPEIDTPPEPLALSDGDLILLATDGLFKTLSVAEMTMALTEPGDPAEALVRKALGAGLAQQDNVTVVAVCCGTAQRGAVLKLDDQEETAEMHKPEIPPVAVEAPQVPTRSGGGNKWMILGLAAVAIAAAFYLMR
ncbi:MAG: PP2C family serine/threonine-protein phosphatase [Acidobacteriota bacterium]